MDSERLLGRLVQTGVVSSIDQEKRLVRVMFPDTGITSGWLYVLQHPGCSIQIVPDAQHTHTISDTYSGGGQASEFPAHRHPGSVTTTWMPKVNDRVVVLFLPIPDGDGFVLGGI